ncbi:cytochrome B [Bacillus sp. AFS002410]|nr:cupredoxin domain-containing protein [Bacillus sp. AFS002410]PEJ59184.1 cytochrome B [Bacillus sp. AFS002410]
MKTKKWLTVLLISFAPFLLMAKPSNIKIFAESAVTQIDNRAPVMVVELDDNYFNPKNITIPNGTKSTLLLRNKGVNPHTFTVKMLNIDVEVQPGKETTISVLPKQATTYDLTCKYHSNVGMVGKVIVK